MFSWKEEYSTGIEKIDEQHQKMFSIGREIENTISTYDGSDISDYLQGVYNDLISYTEKHFKYEEFLMKEAGFVGLDDHINKHQDLLDKIQAIDISDISAQGSTAFSILQLIAEWVYEHIQGDDFVYINDVKRYLEKK